MQSHGLISEGYRGLNRRLHLDNADYGTSGKHYAVAVEALCRILKTTDILDYGCGKQTLSQMLVLRDDRFARTIAEYDPAVPGFDVPPSRPSEVLVCTDVMEHIEPAALDGVLRHIASLTGRVAFFAISCEAALKSLSDGRNAHLIRERPEWWRAKLERHFIMLRMFGIPSGFVFIGQSLNDPTNIPDLSEIGPPPEIKTIQGKSVYSDEQRCAHIRSAMLRGLPTVKVLPPHGKTMVLACYGPSLRDTWGEIKKEVAAGADLYTVSGAHQFLIDRGIVPIGHIESDPRPHAALKFGAPHREVCYFIASACHRDTFDRLTGREVWLCHYTSSPAETSLMGQLDQTGVFTIDGGTNVGMCAIGLGSVLGYRRIIIHGMDCSFRADNDILNAPNDKPLDGTLDRARIGFHAGSHPNENQGIYRVWIGGRPFITSGEMLQGAQDFVALETSNRGDYKFELRGDGFLKNLLAEIQTRQTRVAA